MSNVTEISIEKSIRALEPNNKDIIISPFESIAFVDFH